MYQNSRGSSPQSKSHHFLEWSCKDTFNYKLSNSNHNGLCKIKERQDL